MLFSERLALALYVLGAALMVVYSEATYQHRDGDRFPVIGLCALAVSWPFVVAGGLVYSIWKVVLKKIWRRASD
jgi:hypothetical protein